MSPLCLRSGGLWPEPPHALHEMLGHWLIAAWRHKATDLVLLYPHPKSHCRSNLRCLRVPRASIRPSPSCFQAFSTVPGLCLGRCLCQQEHRWQVWKRRRWLRRRGMFRSGWVGALRVATQLSLQMQFVFCLHECRPFAGPPESWESFGIAISAAASTCREDGLKCLGPALRLDELQPHSFASS